MRHMWIIASVLIATLAAPLSAQETAKPAGEESTKAAAPVAQPGRPSAACEQIAQACKSAGFIFGDYREGNGLWVDCLTPIMNGAEQPSTARISLPEVSPDLVAACKATGSNFGQSQSREPTPKSAQPDQPRGK
jgi:hypothetical protein